MIDRLERLLSWAYTRRLWGSRCLDYEPTCWCCIMWALHDEIFNDGPSITLDISESINEKQMNAEKAGVAVP